MTRRMSPITLTPQKVLRRGFENLLLEDRSQLLLETGTATDNLLGENQADQPGSLGVTELFVDDFAADVGDIQLRSYA